jgi:hypothetical protein
MLTQISGDRVPLLLHRYAKLPDDKLDKIEDIADDALKGVVSSSALPLLTGLGVGFGVAGFSGIPIVGMAAGAYFLYSAVDSALQKGKQAEYIKDVGLIAHALKEPDLVRYAEIVGVDAVVDEILQAYSDGQAITPAARKLCQAMGKSPKRRSIATFLEEIKALQDSPHESAALTTALTAATIAPTIAGGTCKIHTAVDDLVNPVRSSYIAAPPRTGKGILIALAMKEFKRLYPDGTLYSYTPKQDPKEHWYWESSDQHFNPDLDQNPTRAAQSLYAMIRHWQSLPSSPDAPILFVCDELSATMARLKPVKMSEVDDSLFTDDNRPFSVWLLDFLIHEASMRQSVDRFVWVMTPLATVSESGVSASALKSLRNYTLASQQNLKFADGGNASFAAPKITADHPLFNRYKTIAYSHDSQSWLPIPTMQADVIDRLSQSTPKLRMWGDMPAPELVWDEAHPAAVFAAGFGQAFMDVEMEQSEPIDYEKRTQLWAWQKLARFPEGLSRKKLWNDAPKSITREVDRFTFDRYLDSAIESGFIFGGEGEPLTQNPDLSPE